MDISLLDLEPEWIVDAGPNTRMRSADLTPETAQGVMFLCPVCFLKNGGPIGTHAVLTYFRDRGVPDDARPGPGRWVVSGTGFHDLTLSPSVDISSPDRPDEWHGSVTNGRVT